MSQRYAVNKIAFPWYGSDGFLSGRACVLVQLCNPQLCLENKARYYKADQIAERILQFGRPDQFDPIDESDKSVRIPKQRGASKFEDSLPKWVAIIGETQQADNDLLLTIRHVCGKSIYIEIDEARDMCDAHGILPIWEHVCFRPILPTDPTKIQIFHSVVVRGNPTPNEIREFNKQLDMQEFRGDRFLPLTDHNKKLVSTYPRNWRLSNAVG